MMGTLVLVVVSLIFATGCDDDRDAASKTRDGNADRGKQAIAYHGCGSCHTIPGVRGADALVGPSLDRVGDRAYIGGVLPNSRDNLVRWILDPPAVDPQTAMPNIHVSEADARDIAGYLYTLR